MGHQSRFFLFSYSFKVCEKFGGIELNIGSGAGDHGEGGLLWGFYRDWKNLGGCNCGLFSHSSLDYGDFHKPNAPYFVENASFKEGI